MMPPLALWMPYAAAIMALVGAFALLAERYVAGLRHATRFVWLAAMFVGPLISIVLRGDEEARSTAAAAQTAEASPADARVVRSSTHTPSAVRAAESYAGSRRTRTALLLRMQQPLLFVWSIASGSMLLLLACAVVRLQRHTGRAEIAIVDGIAVRLDPALGPSASPFHGGAVLVPAWLETLDAPLRRLVLVHETQHLRAADPTLMLLGAAMVALFPWSPAMWWMRRRLRLAIEIDCDARTLAECGGTHDQNRVRYAQLLILAAQQASTVRRPTGSSAVIPAVSSHLARRLHMLASPATRMTRARGLATAGVMLAIVTLTAAMPRPPRVTPGPAQPAEIVGLYWMMAPDVPSHVMLAPGREFTYLRLAADGRSRLENVAVDASGETVSPSVEVARWSTEAWHVLPAANGVPAKLCWQLGTKMLCSVYAREPRSGDIAIYRDSVGGKIELKLQRASRL
jgi:beta-lactamase regulating signal transducer with metallopeptidase domain